jgi:hypothetical protein
MGLIRKPPKGLAERRQAERRRVIWGSWIAHLDGTNAIKCQTKDISVAGARVQLSEQRAIPSSVYFFNLRDRLVYEAVVAWRNLPEIGLQFGKVYRFVEAPTTEIAHVIKNITL